MGHANFSNFSRLFVDQLYEKGTVSIREVTDLAIEQKESVHASEGDYFDPCMIGKAFEEVVNFLLKRHRLSHRSSKSRSIIEPIELTSEQEERYEEWLENEFDDWDCGDDGRGGEYGVFDSIRWQFTEEWRTKYPEIPLLENFTC